MKNVQAYSQREALGQRWLKDLDAGHFREEPYVAHLGKWHLCPSGDPRLCFYVIELPGRDTAVMLTTSHILSIWYVLLEPARCLPTHILPI